MKRLSLLATAIVLLVVVPASAAGFRFPHVTKNVGSKPRIGKTHGPAPKRLKVKDVVAGTGAVARNGDQVTIQYVGELYKNGKQFDASWDRGQPFAFKLGSGQVIKGFDQGIKGMRVGGRRTLVIPAKLAYGAAGAPPAIPANAPLVFVVDLTRVGS
jgi:FKBP-type peptidyl-prolyl cis-trans isomerase